MQTSRYYLPETLADLVALVSDAHERNLKLRPVGGGLSPNALGFSPSGMVDLALMDGVLSVDAARARVTVQAGARVSAVVAALRPHGLTLANYASVAEQTLGGFAQVGAHGTGAAIPPVDEQVVGLRMVSPAVGEVVLSAEDEDPMLFRLARVGLGLLGVVAEVTLQCVRAHELVERTCVLGRKEVRDGHAARVMENRHVRYMWIPGVDAVVVVTGNAVDEAVRAVVRDSVPGFSAEERLEPARALLKSVPEGRRPADGDIDGLSYTGLRDALIAVDALDPAWIKRVNVVEAEFWRRSEGYRIDWSDRILGFDCGGQQWVSEVAFPVPGGAKDGAEAADLNFVESVLQLIEEESIPAPAPIEQRWTAPSTSPMSPACELPGKPLAPIYSWVGIIMYLPEASSSDGAGGDDGDARLAKTRADITARFKAYKQVCEERLWAKAGAVEHWAKVEVPEDAESMRRLQARIASKYPVAVLNAVRHFFDPKNVLGNDWADAVIGEIPGGESEKRKASTE